MYVFGPTPRYELTRRRLLGAGASLAAILAGSRFASAQAPRTGGMLVVAKTKSERATCALARAPAPIDPERVGRAQGRLAIVGLGPGDPAWRTPEAQALLDDAQDWVGYRGYLDLLGRPHGKAVHDFALGEERLRAEKALDLAASGRRVALVSSGDAGIYAMASLVFELVEQSEEAGVYRFLIRRTA